jgi:hypothetical protein
MFFGTGDSIHFLATTFLFLLIIENSGTSGTGKWEKSLHYVLVFFAVRFLSFLMFAHLEDHEEL